METFNPFESYRDKAERAYEYLKNNPNLHPDEFNEYFKLILRDEFMTLCFLEDCKYTDSQRTILLDAIFKNTLMTHLFFIQSGFNEARITATEAERKVAFKIILKDIDKAYKLLDFNYLTAEEFNEVFQTVVFYYAEELLDRSSRYNPNSDIRLISEKREQAFQLVFYSLEKVYNLAKKNRLSEDEK